MARKRHKGAGGEEEDGRSTGEEEERDALEAPSDEEFEALKARQGRSQKSKDEGMEDSSDSDEEEEGDRDAPIATFREKIELSEAEEEEEEEEEEDAAADPLDLENDCGKVKLIRCKNFLCHRHLEVNLGKNINFITGQNGSGKSAVVAALQICLGMGARETKRGNKLAGLIRHGSQDDAVVTVELYNEGELQAFEPGTFGKVIVIERTIKRSGTSSFKLINGTMKKTMFSGSPATNKVKEMVRFFNIAIDNPCCVLDQETSKTFLRGDAKTKYKVFLRATNIEDMTRFFDDEKEAREAARASLKERKKNVKILKEKVEALEAKIKRFGWVDKLREKVDGLKNQKVWAVVAMHKRELRKAEAELEKQKKKFQDVLKKLELAENSLEESSKEAENLEKNIHKANSAVLEKEKLILDLEKDQKAVQQRIRKAELALVKETKISNRLQKEIESETEKKRNVGKNVAMRNAKISKLLEEVESKIQKAKRALEKAQTSKEGAQRFLEEAEFGDYDGDGRLRDLEAHVRGIKNHMNETRDHIKNLENVGHNANLAFGRDVPLLLELIEQNISDFSRPPLHLGKSTQLKDDKWRRPVEHALNGPLRTFIVNEARDFRLIQDLCKKNQLQTPKVTIMKFLDKEYDIGEGKRFKSRNPAVKSFEDILEICDVNVYNGLVDLGQIEALGLAEDAKTASKTAYEERPPGLNRCYDLSADFYQLRKNGSEYKKAYRSSGREIPLFTKDTTQECDDARGKLKELDMELRTKSKGLEALRKEKHESASKVQMMKKQLNDARRALDMHASMIAKLEEEREDLQSNVEADDEVEVQSQAIQIEIDRMIADLEEKADKIRLYQEDKEKAEKDLAPLDEKLKEIQGALKRLEAVRDKALKDFEDFQTDARTTATQKVRLTAKKEKIQGRFEAAEKEFTQYSNRVEAAREGALNFTNGKEIEVEVGKDLTALAKEIRELEKHIQKETRKIQENSQSGEDIQVLVEKMKAELDLRLSEYKSVKRIIKRQKETLLTLKKAHHKRLNSTDKLKAACELRLRQVFSANLSRRGHGGELVLDEDSETLNFIWRKQDTQTQDDDDDDPGEDDAAVQDAGQLSGGETSFTSLSFLLALGELINSPWRVMDEFDVFMDSSNRKLSLDLLLENARAPRNKTRQYILLTPHDISGVTGNDVHKIRMRPPEKDFGRAQQQVID